MKRVRITVYGRVQRVGYRDRVAEIARKLGVNGTVRNLEDDVSVEIVAEGDGKQVDEFLKQVNISDSPVEVEKLDALAEKPTLEFKHFRIIRGGPYEELGERMDVAGSLLYNMDKKQDKMLIKQDQTIEVLGEFKGKTFDRFDVVNEKYGKISDRLDRISISLEKLVGIFEGFKAKD